VQGEADDHLPHWQELGELGRLLAAAGPHWADLFVAHVATGLRPSELVGLQRYRVDLLRRELRVVAVGVFTTSFKGLRDRPKSRSSMRRVPLAAPAVEAIARHVPPNAGLSTIVFTDPGGGSGLVKGAGQGLTTDSYRHVSTAPSSAQVGSRSWT
jgi:integrase